MLVIYAHNSCRQGNTTLREPAHFTLHCDALLHKAKKKIIVLQVPCQKKTGSVGRLYIFFFLKKKVLSRPRNFQVGRGTGNTTFFFFGLTDQTSMSCNILLCCDSPYYIPCILKEMLTSLLCKLTKIYILWILF